MKKASKSLSKRVLTVLNKDPNFRDAYQMVCNKSKTKPYLVGGKLYRTMIELTYDYPARSHTCDFDFAAEEIRKKKQKFKKKRYTDKYGEIRYRTVPVFDRYNSDSIHMKTESGAKIDLISISDLIAVRAKQQPISIEGYFGSVPLSIQAIAMDVDKCEIFGKIGLDSINEKYVWVNNEFVLNEYSKYKGIRPDNYIKRKADSIKFGCPVKSKPKRNFYGAYKYGMQSQQMGQTLHAQGQQVVNYAANLNQNQLQYLNDIIQHNHGAQVFMHQGELYCIFHGRTFRYNGDTFEDITTTITNAATTTTFNV